MTTSKQTPHDAFDAFLEDQHLAISFSEEDGVFVVTLVGGLVASTSGAMVDALTQLVAWGAKKMLLDLSRVRIMTRAGLRGITVPAKMLQFSGGQMRIFGATDHVRDILENLSMPHLIHLHHTRAEAEAALAQLRVAPSRAHISSAQKGPVAHIVLQSLKPALGASIPVQERDDAA